MLRDIMSLVGVAVGVNLVLFLVSLLIPWLIMAAAALGALFVALVNMVYRALRAA